MRLLLFFSLLIGSYLVGVEYPTNAKPEDILKIEELARIDELKALNTDEPVYVYYDLINTKNYSLFNQRYQRVKQVASKFNRPFTVLQIGSDFGYIGMSLAREFYDKALVTLAAHNAYLPSIVRVNADFSGNVILLDKNFTVAELQELARHEHFDLVIADIIFKNPTLWKQYADVIFTLGDHVLIESPAKIDPILISTPQIPAIVTQLVKRKGYTVLLTPQTNAKTLWWDLAASQPVANLQFWPFPLTTVWLGHGVPFSGQIDPPYRPGEEDSFRQLANWDDKVIAYSNGVVKEAVNGLNYDTFYRYNGVFPSLETLESKYLKAVLSNRYYIYRFDYTVTNGGLLRSIRPEEILKRPQHQTAPLSN